MQIVMAQISLRSLIRAVTVRKRNNRILQKNVWLQSKGPDDAASVHAQDDLNLRMLRTFEGTFLLDTAYFCIVAHETIPFSPRG